MRFLAAIILLLLSAPVASAGDDGPVFCPAGALCPSGYHCHWGICLADKDTRTTRLFTIQIGTIRDRTPGGSGARNLQAIRARLRDLLQSTGWFQTRLPKTESPLLDGPEDLARRGVAWHLGGEANRTDKGLALDLDLRNTASNKDLEPLNLQAEGLGAALDQALIDWVNAMVGHFSGQPGIMGVQIACVKKLGWGKKEVWTFRWMGDNFPGRQLTTDGSLAVLPAWTPDNRIAYTSYKDKFPGIRIVGMEKPFANHPPMATGIDWSPDGSSAALTLIVDENSEIFLVEGATGALRARLTFHPAIDTTPKFSPRGDRIAFVSDRRGTPQIYLMNSNGFHKRRLTHSGAYNTSPSWHPNSRQLVYTTRRGGFQIVLMDTVTGETDQLTSERGDHENPTFSPDGRWIAYTSSRGKRRDLYLMDIHGHNHRRINTDDGLYYNPVFQKVVTTAASL